jgi:hypothetical protein
MTHNIGEMERFFAELDGLREAEIKARLRLGVGMTRSVAGLSYISTRRRRNAKEPPNQKC